MKILKKLSLICCLWLSLLPAQAGMITTGELIKPQSPVVDYVALRLGVEKQLIEHGLQPELASKRVAAMSDAQLVNLQQDITRLPAGAGVSTTNLLLIIIILLLVL